MRATTLLPVAALSLAVPAAWLARAGDEITLQPGVPIDVEVVPGAEPRQVFKIRVPERSTGLSLRTLGATGDVELYAAFEEVPDPAGGSWDVTGLNTWLDEEILLERSDMWPLESGTWYVVVLSPEIPGFEPEPIRCRLLAELLEPPQRSLALGERAEIELERRHGLRFTFELPAAETDSALRIEAFSPLADVDILLGEPPAQRARQAPLAEGSSLLGYERVELPSRARHGNLVIEVLARPEFDTLERYPVTVLAVPAGDARTLCPPQSVPAAVPQDRPLEQVLAATVAIFGRLGAGSGVVVSAAGHVISNAHVVVGARGGAALDLALAFTADPRLPPVPAFALEILDFREDLDLVLMRIASGLDGRPLEPGLAFPNALPHFQADPRLGDELLCLGYPMTGGSGSMVTISLTRGVLAGFARENEGPVYKTDGSVHAGVSGGACVDDHGRLIGFPSSSIADSNAAGGLGFVLPVTLLPQEWRVLVGGR